MRVFSNTAIAGFGLAAAALLLSACSSQQASRPVSRAPASRPAAVPSPRPLPAPVYAAAPGRSSEQVWKLRAGLNVAALSCRGRGKASVTGAYGRLLSHHRALLASAYQTEQRRLGQAAFDRQQTRIYNRFANQRSPVEFCATAASIASRASSMDSASLPPAAPRMVSELESRLR